MAMNTSGKMKGNLTEGSPLTCMAKYVIPLILGNLFQQFYNIADSVIVGRMISKDALAAVGASSTLTALFVMVAIGTGVGCSVVIAQLFGAGQHKKLKTAISTEILTVLGLSLLLSLIGVLCSGFLLRWLNTPDNIYEDARAYLNIYFYGFFFLFLYNAFSSVFNALGDSKKPLYFLIFSSFLNVGLDVLLIGTFHMGVAGAAWATLIAQAVSAVLSFGVLVRKLKGIETDPYEKYDIVLLKSMVKVAWPSILQQSIVSIGGILIQACVNGFGSDFIAGYTAATKLDGIAIVPLVNIGNAVSTFVAQNKGAKKLDRIQDGCKIGVAMSAAFSFLIALVLHLSGRSVIGLFMEGEESLQAITVGTRYLMIVSKCYFFMGLMKIFAGALRGVGDMKTFVRCTMVSLAVRIILTYAFADATSGMSVAWAVVIGWAVGGLIAYLKYRKGQWQGIELI